MYVKDAGDRATLRMVATARPVEPLPPSTPLRKKTGFIVSEYGEGVMIEFEKFIVLIKPKE